MSADRIRPRTSYVPRLLSGRAGEVAVGARSESAALYRNATSAPGGIPALMSRNSLVNRPFSPITSWQGKMVGDQAGLRN